MNISCLYAHWQMLQSQACVQTLSHETEALIFPMHSNVASITTIKSQKNTPAVIAGPPLTEKLDLKPQRYFIMKYTM